MKFDANLLFHELEELPALVRFAEDAGFDGVWTFETAHDPFLPLVLAAEHSRRISLGTSIAVAFPRSPAILAYTAWDLARLSKGRFILGLGTQVRGHNERRFGVRWERPVEKIREVILAVRAFWDCWQNKTPLFFEGEFFKFNLMTPFFSPTPHAYSRIPIFVAGVNRRMCRVAGELCDGFHVHPLHTPRYLRQVILPAIESGLASAGRRRSDLELSSSLFVIPTDDAGEARDREREVRREIAFYASTPAYRPVFELSGWGEVAERLSRMAAAREWDGMPGLISDAILEAFAVRGTWAALPGLVLARYQGLLDRVSYYMPITLGREEQEWRSTVAGYAPAR
jgi:probable F420-dependent oxidoreductase